MSRASGAASFEDWGYYKKPEPSKGRFRDRFEANHITGTRRHRWFRIKRRKLPEHWEFRYERKERRGMEIDTARKWVPVCQLTRYQFNLAWNKNRLPRRTTLWHLKFLRV